MSIATVSVPVPLSGDGPAVSVADLVGAKTVILSGYYQGSYLLLASHDGSEFVPALTFDSDGRDSIRLTLPNAYKFVRVRAGVSTVPAGVVTVTVTGISSPGENLFAVLATFLPGGGGSVTIDTAPLFPPAGLESDINIICRGGLAGTLLVEGSQDGAGFNPLGAFQGGAQSKTLLGLPAPLEFEPLTTGDQTRYLRLSVQGQVTSLLTVTIGGLVQVPQPSSTTLAEAYDNGASPADQTFVLADALGGGLVVDGTSPGFAGSDSLVVLAPGGQSVSFPKTGGIRSSSTLWVGGSAAVGVPAATARLELAGGTGAPGTASLKVDAGVLLAVAEPGAVESSGVHLYWTDMGGARWQLDGGAGGGVTLAQAYALGSAPSDQTLGLLDVRGGGFVVDGTAPGFTGAYALTALGSQRVSVDLAVGVASATARVHVAATTAAAGTASLKIPSGVVLAVKEPGAVEADAAHLYWTSAAGTRLQLDNAAVTTTLAQAYANGAAPADQTMVLGDADGGGVVVDGTGAGFTGQYSLAVLGSEFVLADLAVGVLTATARVHAAATTAAAGTASLKIPSGVVLAVKEPGAVEADAAHLYWTSAAGARLQLDNAAVTTTLAQAYANGAAPADQTMVLGDADGGGVVVDGTGAGFTGAYALSVLGSQLVQVNLAVGVLTATARVHAAATTAAAGTASLKIPSGVVLTVKEPGAVEADAAHLYWTSAAGSRLQLDNTAVTTTLAEAYGNGSAPADQTLLLLDASGGGLVVDGTNPGFTAPYALTVLGDEFVLADLAVGVLTPTARVHAAATTAAAGTASLKIPSGVVLSITEPGAVEADANHLYWTSAAGTRLQLDDAPVNTTLAQIYANGSAPADQTMALLDTRGGGVVVDGTAPGFTGSYALAVLGSARVSVNLAAGVVAATARVHAAATTAAAGTASLKIPSGTVLTVTEPGAVEADAAHLYWTSAAGTRLQLDNSAPTTTLAQAYANGAAPADQTLVLLDTEGGGLVVSGVSAGFTGQSALKVTHVSAAATLNQSTLLVSGNFSPTGGNATYEAASLVYTVNQTGGASGAVTGLLLQATETAVVGTHNLVDLQVAAVSRFSVNNAGAVAHSDGLLATPSITWLSDTSGGIYHAGTGTSGVMRMVVNGGAVVNVTQYGVGLSNTFAASTGAIPAAGNTLLVDTSKTLAAGAGQKWQGVYLNNSTLTLTGTANPTSVRLMEIGSPTVDAALACTITDFYDLLVGQATTVNNAAITRNWSIGTLGPVQLGANAGLVLGAGLAPPGESDLVIAAGATNVSAANTGRLGYLAGAVQQFMVSRNAGAYVPLLAGPAAGGFTQGSVPFGLASGQLGQDNANFFWDDTNVRLGVGATPTATLQVSQQAINAAAPTAFLLVGGAHTAITASAEDVGANLNFSATKTWATGAVATQREILIQAPTYAFAGASTITNAATVAITNAPQLGANATITNSYALWVQAGNTQLANNVGIGGTIAASTSLEVVSGSSTSTSGNATHPGMVKLTANSLNGPETVTGLEFQYNNGGGGAGYGFKLYTDNSHDSLALATRAASATWTTQISIRNTTGNVVIGNVFGGYPSATTKLLVSDSPTITAATGATWDSFKILSGLTISGATSPITTLNLASIPSFAAQISAASAVVISDFYMLRIGAAVFGGAGPARATRSWSLGIDGNTLFGGGQTVHGTDINVAGPYTILQTDYFLHVRRTATAAISLNLPSIATVGDGFVIVAKDSGYNASVNPITWVRSGTDTIENTAGNYTQNISGSCIVFTSNATTNNWELS